MRCLQGKAGEGQIDPDHAADPRTRLLWPIAAAAAVVLLDQLVKAVVRSTMETGSVIPLIPGILSLRHLENAGAAFSLFQGMRYLMVAVSVVAFVLLFVALWRRWIEGRVLTVVIGAVAGGVAGNLIDRATRGTVTDFVDLHFWPVFNVADMAISIGCVVLIATIVLSKDSGEHGRKPADGDNGV